MTHKTACSPRYALVLGIKGLRMGSTLRLLSETFPPHIDLTTAPFYTTVSCFQNKSWVTLALVGYVRTKRPTWEAIRGLARSQVMISCHQDREGILVRLGDPLRCTVPQGPPLDFSNRTAKSYQLGDDKLLLWRLSYDIGSFWIYRVILKCLLWGERKRNYMADI